MRLALDTAPAEEPVSLEEAKDHLRVDTTAEDAAIASWIESARVEAERASGRALVTQTWEGKLDRFPECEVIEFPRPPLQSVTSIKYIDTNGTLQTLSSSTYTVDTSGIVGRVYLNYSESWPLTRIEPNAVRIVFVAGYGGASDVPEPFRSWILLRVGERYALREGTVTGTIATRLPNVDTLVMGERVGF